MKPSSNRSTSDGASLSVAKFLGWMVLGGASTLFLFFWCIVGLGEVFGGTEVGDGRVPGVGVLWWVFMIGCIPVTIVGGMVTPFLIAKAPSVFRVGLAVLGVISLVSIAVVVVGITSGAL